MRKLMDWIVQLIIGLFGAGGLGTVIAQWWLRRRRRKGEKRRAAAYHDIVGIYEHMNVLKSESMAQRVLVLETTNNGGIPAAGCRIFSSVLYEVWEPPLESIKKFWQKQEVDEDYCTLITRLDAEGRVTREIDNIPVDSQLGHLYRHNEIKCAHIFKIGGDGRSFYYLSVLFSHDEYPREDEDHKFEDVARGCLNEIRRKLMESGAIYEESVE